MILTAAFLFNLLCAMVPCDPYYTYPKPQEQLLRSSSIPIDTVVSLKEFHGSFKRSGFPSVDESPPDPFVVTKSGAVQGYFMKIIDDKNIYAFEGIPYAQPPTGYFRFRVRAVGG
jgi:hypothetical protein